MVAQASDHRVTGQSPPVFPGFEWLLDEWPQSRGSYVLCGFPATCLAPRPSLLLFSFPSSAVPPDLRLPRDPVSRMAGGTRALPPRSGRLGGGGQPVTGVTPPRSPDKALVGCGEADGMEETLRSLGPVPSGLLSR